MTDRLRIGKLATMLGITTKTLRFYEDSGLLGDVARTDASYRIYSSEVVSRAQLVIGLRRLGLNINELKSLFNGDTDHQLRREVLGILDEKLFNLDRDLNVLQGQREDLSVRQQALLLTPRDRPPDCVCDALLIKCACDTT